VLERSTGSVNSKILCNHISACQIQGRVKRRQGFSRDASIVPLVNAKTAVFAGKDLNAWNERMAAQMQKTLR
jgi:hypothetical protein